MRKIMLLAAVVAALGMLSQPTEARDRGFGVRHFSGHAGPKLHLRHHGLKFHHGGFLGKNRPFKSRHFGHFGHGGRAFKFGHVPHFKPRHFGHFGQGGFVLKFSDGDFVLSSAICRISSIVTSVTSTITTGCSLGLTCHGSSGHGMIAALPSKIGMAFTRTARACRARKSARSCPARGPP
jgi:hypothetical protein